MSKKKEFYTVAEIAGLQKPKVATNTVYTWVKNGQKKTPVTPYIPKEDVINPSRPVLVKLTYKVIR